MPTPNEYGCLDEPLQPENNEAEMDALENVYKLYVAFRAAATNVIDTNLFNDAVIDSLYDKHVKLYPQEPFNWR